MEIIVKEVTVKEILDIHKKIPEFSETPPSKFVEINNYQGKRKLVLEARFGKEAIGYMVAYDRFQDKSFYCWITGVIPSYRNHGALSAMMNYLFNWAKLNGYSKIKLKSRNIRREMNAYLVKRGFFFTSVEQRENIKDNRISAECEIEDNFDFVAQV